MKILFFALLFFFFSASSTFAQTDWVINNFQSSLTIEQNGTLSVTETISVDFKSLEKHGIYRDIPVVYEDPSGGKTYTQITLKSVTQDDATAKYEISHNEYNMRIRIGDANKTINGPHTYVITYTATGVLRSFSDHDELYWNVTGNDWEATIENASATVTLPKEKTSPSKPEGQSGIEQTKCYEGETGAITECLTQMESARVVLFQNFGRLYPRDGMTIVVGYTKGMVPILTVAPPKQITDDLFSPLSQVAFITAALLGIFGVLFLWFKRGRDFWFRAPSRLDPNAVAEQKPLGAKVITTVEFTPPDNLRPAELGVLMDERADTLDVTATIIDLANRGFLTIVEIDKKWLFGSKNYELQKKDKATTTLLPYEKLLFDRIFATGDTIKMSELKTTFYDDLAEVKKELYKNVVDKKLFIGNPETIRGTYTLISVLVMFAAFGGIFLGFGLVSGPILAFSIGLILSSIFFVIMSRSMSRRSALGHELYQRTKGYLLFIGGAEKYRQQFFEKKNMFNEVLPYAIVFGLTAKFAQAMKDMGITPQNPSWYHGTHTFTPVVFGSNINSFSNSLSTAIASTPSKSGGFSGGSSGGGFGGGGGGSW